MFLSATKRISSHSTPLLHHVIPLFDIITRKLDAFVDDEMLHPCVRVAAARGRRMLNKYYGLSDDSIMYRVAMRKLLASLLLLNSISSRIFAVLHPKYKSAYFIKAGWPSEWIKMAEDLLRSQWKDHYKPISTETGTIPSVSHNTLPPISC